MVSNSISWMGNRVVDTTPRADPAPVGESIAEPPVMEPGYIPYYLKSNIGKSVRAEFVIGVSQYVDKTGVISEVGVNYFVLSDAPSRTKTMCDLYSVKFVTILEG